MYSNFIFRFSFSIPEDATVVAKARMIILINVFKLKLILLFLFSLPKTMNQQLIHKEGIKSYDLHKISNRNIKMIYHDRS